MPPLHEVFESIRLVKVPENGGPPEFVRRRTVDIYYNNHDEQDASLMHIPDLRDDWGDIAWQERQTVKYLAGSGYPPKVRGIYFTFKTNDQNLQQHKLVEPHGWVWGDAFIAKVSDRVTGDDDFAEYEDVPYDFLDLACGIYQDCVSDAGGCIKGQHGAT